MRNGPYELVVAPPNYPGKKYRGRYVYEHQLVWWRTTGIVVPKGMVIHHKNEQKRDNRFENLELKSASAHTSDHHPGPQNNTSTLLCAWCKATFCVPSRERSSRCRRGRKNVFCCRSHAVQHQHAERNKTATDSTLPHGIMPTYRKGCRCDLCRSANAATQRSYRSRKKQ